MTEGHSTDGGALTGVGMTALIVAQARAVESQRPDRLFDDPFAASFVDLAGPGFLAAAAELAPILKLRGNGSYFAIRTRFFDDCLLAAVRAGCRQVALLGAGLDTRAYRLDLPADLSLYELDLPDVLALKARVLETGAAAPSCRRVAVPVDLRGDWPGALLSAGFVASQPTAWLAEGVLMYLNEAERDHLLESIGVLSEPGSRIVLDQRGAPVPEDTGSASDSLGTAARVVRERVDEAEDEIAERFGAMTSSERPDPSMVEPVAWLSRHGWRGAAYGAAEGFAYYGRPVPEVLRTGAVQIWLASAEREAT